MSATNQKLFTTSIPSSTAAIGQWTSQHAPPDVCGTAHELTCFHELLFFNIIYIY
jgi:hypothetical protein